MKKKITILLFSILIFIMLVGCSSTGSKPSRKALEEEAISIYEEVNGYGSAKRDGFVDSIEDMSDDELQIILGY